ncbi:MAG TPA: hypothetical protein GXX55_06760 [Firmicutes bacterium]|nr:hypothetical protein [Bacillota bacterium]
MPASVLPVTECIFELVASPWEALEERPRAAWGYLGYASTSPVSRTVAALMEEARHLVAARVGEAGGIKGRAVIRRLRVYDAAVEVLADGDIGEGGDGKPGACNPQVWQTPTLARRLSGCDRLVALACTLGPGVDDAIHTAFAENPGLAVVLDAVGSAMVGGALDLFVRQLKAEAERRGFKQVRGYAPGYQDWPITDQSGLLDLVQASKLGIVINESGMMRPAKSLTTVLGWKSTGASR